MYFIDLEAINSLLREYLAIIHSNESPLINYILGKQNLVYDYENDPKRKILLDSQIFF